MPAASYRNHPQLPFTIARDGHSQPNPIPAQSLQFAYILLYICKNFKRAH
jgi:hypothetical protein